MYAKRHGRRKGYLMGFPISLERDLVERGLIPSRTIQPSLEISEKQFQTAITDHAESRGWHWYHTYDSRKSKSGWPDLVLVRDRIIFAELKTEIGTLDAEQSNWRDRIVGAGGEWHLWRPSDWQKIVEVLK